jgi:hypothetical protein
MSGHTNFGNPPEKDLDAKLEKENELNNCYIVIEALLEDLKNLGRIKDFGRTRSEAMIMLLKTTELPEQKIKDMFRSAARTKIKRVK